MNEEELLERQRQREIIEQIYANKPSLLNYGTRLNAMGMMNDDVKQNVYDIEQSIPVNLLGKPVELTIGASGYDVDTPYFGDSDFDVNRMGIQFPFMNSLIQFMKQNNPQTDEDIIRLNLFKSF